MDDAARLREQFQKRHVLLQQGIPARTKHAVQHGNRKVPILHHEHVDLGIDDVVRFEHVGQFFLQAARRQTCTLHRAEIARRDVPALGDSLPDNVRLAGGNQFKHRDVNQVPGSEDIVFFGALEIVGRRARKLLFGLKLTLNPIVLGLDNRIADTLDLLGLADYPRQPVDAPYLVLRTTGDKRAEHSEGSDPDERSCSNNAAKQRSARERMCFDHVSAP